MNRNVVQSSPVQQMMAGNPNNWWNLNTMRPPSSPQPSPFFSTTPSNFLTAPYAPSTSLPFPSWHENHQELREPWSHLLMSGMMGEEEKGDMCKKMEKWEEQMLREGVDVKQESSYVYGSNQEFQAANNWSHQIVSSSSSPKSCVTSFTTNMLDFSHNNNTNSRPPPPDPSSECNSTPSGGALKKARVQPCTTSQSNNTFKVRKEKLGDRITALHQLVSPFGKTDTASVLLESIGYIRFLQNQIEALSLPYLGSGSGNMRHQQSVQGEKNCIFPEHPGQLLNEKSLKRKATTGDHQQDSEEEPKKDLRSRGLCLVPVSCTLQVESENGADYWAPAFGGGFR